METIVSIPGFEPVKFEVSNSESGPAFFALGVRKSGSTLFMQTCRALAGLNGIPFVDVAGTFFKHNIPVGEWIRSPVVKKVLQPGNVYGGFRSLPTSLADTACFRNARKILLVRDPRDALVSEYFSTAFSHSIPNGVDTAGVRKDLLDERHKARNSSLEDYVIRRAVAMSRTLTEYGDLRADPKALVLKYEDIVFDKEKMIDAILERFGWHAPAPAIARLMARIDIRPQEEQPREFIRRVAPGDHREKLGDSVISQLNSSLHDSLALFGYS